MARRRRSRPEPKPVARRRSRPKPRKGTLLTLAILAVLLAIILAVVLSSPLVRPPSGTDRVAIRFTSTDGRLLTTSAAPFAGKVVLVDLMAANCAPCNAEMPELLAFWRAVQGMDVELVSLSIWVAEGRGGEDVEALRAFRDFYGAGWTFGVPEDTLSLVVEYGVQFPPFKLLLDRQGKIVWTKFGETTSDVLLAVVNEAL